MKNKGMLLSMSINAAAMVWDYKTTRHCIETHNGKEGNPLMGNSRAQELGVGISLTALTYFMSGKLKKQGDGNYAFGVLWGGTMLHVLAGAHNWAICGG
jgi:PAB1-binding protein PBP1